MFIPNSRPEARAIDVSSLKEFNDLGKHKMNLTLGLN